MVASGGAEAMVGVVWMVTVSVVVMRGVVAVSGLPCATGDTHQVGGSDGCYLVKSKGAFTPVQA